MRRVLSLGYDLGDGETIIDAVTFEYDPNNQQRFIQGALFNVRMPNTPNAGEAIPTEYGYAQGNEIVFAPSIANNPQGITNVHSYFKRKPTDLLGVIDSKYYYKLKKLFSTRKWPNESECPEVYSNDFLVFKESVQTFTNAIFSNEQFQQSIQMNLVNCDEIIICVGYPTKWNDLDQIIYEAILKGSIIGQEKYLNKPCSFILAAESRAAYLCLKDKGVVQNTPQGTCSLLIDVGSSTIDVTAVTQDSRNYSYNDGNNYLGVRSIDFMIKDWYFEKLKTSGFSNAIEDIIKDNPSQKNSVILKCRKAKEAACSTNSGNIVFGMIAIPLGKNDIYNLASTIPLIDILKKITSINPEDSAKFGNKCWKDCFKEFLETQKSELNAKNLPIGRIIVTGGASKMAFVPQIVQNVFKEVSKNEQHLDADSSRTISKGLALVGPSDTKSKQFQETVEHLNETEIPQIISDDLDSLANAISPIIEEIVTDIILKRVNQWRKGDIQTINEMTTEIESDLSEDKFKQKLESNEKYNDAIKNWTVNILGQHIAERLEKICKNYQVTNFTINDLNAMKTLPVNPTTGKIEINPLNGIIDVANSIAGLIGATLIVIFLPTILTIILNIIAAFSTTIAGLLFTALVSAGPIGIGLVALIITISVAKIIELGFDTFRKTFNNKVADYNIPLSFSLPPFGTIRPREKLTNAKIQNEIQKQNIPREVKKTIAENKSNISSEISDAIRNQVKQKTDDIKYCIESR